MQPPTTDELLMSYIMSMGFLFPTFCGKTFLMLMPLLSQIFFTFAIAQLFLGRILLAIHDFL